MRERDINRKLFHTAHYEIIAKQFRNALEPILEIQEMHYRTQSGAVVNLAISMAKRFALDNEDFDPHLFLDRCSPDSFNYPLSELWEGVNRAEEVDG